MTVKEAIDDIRECIQPVIGGISLEMAIDALKEKLNEEEPKTFCDTCGHQFSDICGGCESLDGVPVKHKRKTHFDEVRAMSVEELAEWFFTSMSDMGIQCNPCRGAFDCKYCLLEWLKQEITDDT